MHSIRLRQPWAGTRTEDATAIVYSRKFHKPTGIEQQPIALKISLLSRDDQNVHQISVVVNGADVEPLPALTEQAASLEPESKGCICFQLRNLQPFNILEIRISGSIPTVDKHVPTFDATVVPTFGSFVIESVELQIE